MLHILDIYKDIYGILLLTLSIKTVFFFGSMTDILVQVNAGVELPPVVAHVVLIVVLLVLCMYYIYVIFYFLFSIFYFIHTCIYMHIVHILL